MPIRTSPQPIRPMDRDPMRSDGIQVVDSSEVHYSWNNDITPRCEIASGTTMTFVIRGGGDNFYTPESTHADVLDRPPFTGHPLSGPVSIRGARPGDALRVDVVAIDIWDWGYTFIGPGIGLLSGELDGPFLKIWDLSKPGWAPFAPGIEVPIDPFLGVLGNAPAESGDHSTMPPRRVGGNLDVKHLTEGSTVWLPIEVEGGLFSAGDAHAAQGDGEVCGTAIETGATATLHLTLVPDMHLSAPEYLTKALTTSANTASWYGTTGIGPDLMTATKDAIRAMIRRLEQSKGLSAEEAYILCSVAVDLKINEVVDSPNWVVSANLPMVIFGE